MAELVNLSTIINGHIQLEFNYSNKSSILSVIIIVYRFKIVTLQKEKLAIQAKILNLRKKIDVTKDDCPFLLTKSLDGHWKYQIQYIELAIQKILDTAKEKYFLTFCAVKGLSVREKVSHAIYS